MRVAITGGTGFVGRHLAKRLDPADTVIVSRRTGVPIDDVDALTAAFAGCDVVAHCAGINREIGDQTFARVHVDGTRAVVEAARRTGVRRIVMLSFLRARPDCGSAYHETKWAAEELVRRSGIDHTILKAGMIYGSGDHMVDHATRAVRTWPVSRLWGAVIGRSGPCPSRKPSMCCSQLSRDAFPTRPSPSSEPRNLSSPQLFAGSPASPGDGLSTYAPRSGPSACSRSSRSGRWWCRSLRKHKRGCSPKELASPHLSHPNCPKESARLSCLTTSASGPHCPTGGLASGTSESRIVGPGGVVTASRFSESVYRTNLT